MRRNLCRFSCSAKSPTFTSSSVTSFCSSAGRGRGRGRGSTVSNSIFTNNDDSASPTPPPPSAGHGRILGQPLTSSPIVPPFSSFVGNSVAPGPDRGRGRGTGGITMPPTIGLSDPSRGTGGITKPPTFAPSDSSIGTGGITLPPTIGTSDPSSKPIFEGSDDSMPAAQTLSKPPIGAPNSQNMPGGILSVLSGAGRGKPSEPQSEIAAKPKEENRHIQPRQTQQGTDTGPRQYRSVEENSAANMNDGSGGRGGLGERYNRGRGFQGARGRGGRARGGGRGGGRDLRDRRGQADDSEDESDSLYLGDNADGERLAARLGPEKMNMLTEAFEEICGRVLPSPMEDAIVDALHTNLLIECEPEYLMEEFGTNPDIDEKPIIPLRDALEKMKPFLMIYEGIESQEEWEAIIEDLMTRVPLIKEIVDHYSGPDRVTAKQQHQELERVANTLPPCAPNSLNRFTKNAVLSLQSNPGWGFDKKCQLMDTLVREISQNYK